MAFMRFCQTLLLLVLLCCFNPSQAQPCFDVAAYQPMIDYQEEAPSSASARIQIRRGGHIEFYFQSLSHYETGLSYINWSVFGLFFDDTVDPAREYYFSVSGTDLEGTNDPSNTLESDLLLIETSFTGAGTHTPTAVNQYTRVQNTEVNIITGGKQGSGVENEVTLSYYFNVIPAPDAQPASSLLGQAPDYYVGLITFSLGSP